MIDGGGLTGSGRGSGSQGLSPAYLFPLVNGQPGGPWPGRAPSAERVRGTTSVWRAQAW